MRIRIAKERIRSGDELHRIVRIHRDLHFALIVPDAAGRIDVRVDRQRRGMKKRLRRMIIRLQRQGRRRRKNVEESNLAMQRFPELAFALDERRRLDHVAFRAPPFFKRVEWIFVLRRNAIDRVLSENALALRAVGKKRERLRGGDERKEKTEERP